MIRNVLKMCYLHRFGFCCSMQHLMQNDAVYKSRFFDKYLRIDLMALYTKLFKIIVLLTNLVNIHLRRKFEYST